MKTIYIKLHEDDLYKAGGCDQYDPGSNDERRKQRRRVFYTALRKAASRMYNVLPEDVVEVVRCRECANCDDKTPYELWCLGRGWPHQMVPPDGFCDRGKRRPDT